MSATGLPAAAVGVVIAVGAALLMLPAASGIAQTTGPAPASAPSPAGRIVKEVRILGNAQVPTSVIRNVIRTAAGSPYDTATVHDDYHRIFELKKFANVEPQWEPTPDGGVIVYFIVTEQKLIKKITWHGNMKVDTPTLQSVVDLKVGQAIDYFRIALAKQAVINTYRDKNFPFAHVDVPTDPLTQRGELIFEIVEGPQVRIRNINFIGARSFTPDTLQGQIKTETWFPIFRPGKYDPEQVEEDMGALRKWYTDHGFFDVRVGRKLVFSPDQSELQIDFLIDEGPRYVVDRVSFAFSGYSPLGEADLRKSLKLSLGRYYDSEAVQRDVQQLVRDYSRFGYIYAQPGLPGQRDPDYLTVAPQTVYLPQAGRVELLYNIRVGKSFRVGPIIVRGNHKSQQKLVLREFRDFVPGQVYNSGAVQDALERLRALPFFESVTATPIGDDPQYRSLLVEVTEKKTANLIIGAGVSSNGGLSGNLVYEQQNFDISNVPADWRDLLSEHAFTGAGQGLRASFSPGTIYTNADLRFSEPWLFDQPYSFVNDAYLRDAIREHYTDRRIGDAITFGKRLDYENQVATTLRAEQVNIFSIDDPRYRASEILEGRGTHLVTSVGLSYQRNTTNPGFLPYRGNEFDAGVEFFGAMGGDYSFQKIAFGWSGYQTVYEDLLERKTVLAVRLNSGFITGRSVFFERFYAGDYGSVRGFRYRGISPRSGRGDDPVGGDFSITGTAELNFPIYQNMLRGVVFADIGDVENDVRFGAIRTSVGAGIRFTLPFLGPAPFAIDFGVPLVRGHHDETQLISFSLGLLGR